MKHDWHPDHDEVLHEPEKYMLENIEFFAMHLWKGEQVDGTVLQSWARIYKEENITPAVGGTIRADRITKFPSAVMALGRLPIHDVLQVDAAVYASFDAR